MDLATLLPLLLGLAWLLPLASFAAVVLFGPRMGKGGHCGAYVAAGAIIGSFLLSAISLAAWLSRPKDGPSFLCGDWYALAEFGSLRVTIGYYIDALTVAMFTMVALIASCIHVYSMGYMHEELHDVTDVQVQGPDGRPVRRPGRYPRFFQYLSLFCFSMLGLVIAGNIAMVFVFWELVGICSYFLIGFYRERKSASNAANKAFIVNRVGDFGMLIGLMAVWTGFGTFAFGDVPDATGHVRPGIFSQARPELHHHELTVPDGMVKQAAREEVAAEVHNDNVVCHGRLGRVDQSTREVAGTAETAVAHESVSLWRSQGYGYWLLVIAGLGIFCGCVGKSAQFPLFVWLPDAMEGPTPVSALIHAATMVAAGVYLVGRFYPVFTPEVLLVIAYVGCITLFIAATIALVATDIKRVLAYSTVSQLGYMMLALGIGGWLAGMFHLFTHAFFKALLFLCSGSVIHACGTNEMPQMGGLRKKMPWTAYTMLVGCLAIAGAGVPLVIGLSGYYSKDYIIAQALAFKAVNPTHGWLFYAAVGGAALTAFYMFRLWYMTFAGPPRDKHVFEHAHESPKTMVGPLVILAILAIVAGWRVPWTGLGLEPLLKQARPVGTEHGITGGQLWPGVTQPSEHATHASHTIHIQATLIAFGMALLGFLLATVFYGLRRLDPADAKRQFAPLHSFLLHKWYFDELYQRLFVRPVLVLSGWVAQIDRRGIDWLADGAARLVAVVSRVDNWIDRVFVDTTVNLIARWTHTLGLKLRRVQTGNIQQYVIFIAVGTVALFVLMSMFWNYAMAAM
jgi:NADH-quinone oxidoreductase subunit L